MGDVMENIVIKDREYYDDLIYEIRCIAGLQTANDQVKNNRIVLRKKEVEVEENGVIVKSPSAYTLELMEVLERVKKISEDPSNQLDPSVVFKSELKPLMIKRYEVMFQPIVTEYIPIRKEYQKNEGHKGFVEWQPVSKRYVVSGTKPRQQEPDKVFTLGNPFKPKGN